jgi:hypothetical protein
MTATMKIMAMTTPATAGLTCCFMDVTSFLEQVIGICYCHCKRIDRVNYLSE